MRRSVVPHSSGAGAVIVPRAMDATKHATGFLAAVLIGGLVIVAVGFIGILLS